MSDTRPASSADSLGRVPPEGLFVVGAISQYLGAAIAVGLFDEIDAAGVAWLRVVGAALVVIGVRRSWRRSWTRSELGWAAAFGTVLALMNLCFYLSIEELPLGNAVAIEFAGPIVVAAIGTRSTRNGLALVLTVAGVVTLAEVTPEATARGVGFALLSAVFWAGYIVLGHRVARSGTAVDGLGVGMAFGAMAIAPLGAPAALAGIDEMSLLLLALATGVLSNAIPYGIDQMVLQRIARARFALLQALLPVTATIIGLVSLDQSPSAAELVGISLVIVALLFSRREPDPLPPS